MSLIRLDILLHQRQLAASRELARALILEGAVWSENRRLEKPGMRVSDTCQLEIRSRQPRFVSRAGEKLESAIEKFSIEVQDRICLDVGASTGGFTDCLLQRGAKSVFAVDVGHGQLDYKLRKDPRVYVIEKFNARYLSKDALVEHSPEALNIEFACADTSFISLKHIVGPIKETAPKLRDLVVLFKPQFEVGREHVKRGGFVEDQEVIASCLQDFDSFMMKSGFRKKNGPERSPVPGKKSGNVEFLIHYEIEPKK